MPESTPVAFPFHLGDYARDTGELSQTEHGAYLGLLRWYYSNGGPIPNDPAGLRARCGARTERERNAITKVLAKYFALDRGYWRNKKADAILIEWRARSAKAAKAISIRWEREKTKQINDRQHTTESSEYIHSNDSSMAPSNTMPLPLESKSKALRASARETPVDNSTDRPTAHPTAKPQTKANGTARPDAIPWHRSDAGIMAKATTLGIAPRAGESYTALRNRCWQTLTERQRSKPTP